MSRKGYMDQKLTSWNGTVLTLAWVDGTAQEFDASELPEAMQRDLMMHGLKQRLRDDASDAGQMTDPVGYSKECAKIMFEQLMSGNWRKQGTVSGKVVDLIEALRRVSGEDADKCRAVVSDMEPKQRKALEANPEIAAAMAEILAEKAQGQPSTIDVMELFQK